MIMYCCIYIVLIITNMQSYIENAELIKQTILTRSTDRHSIDAELVYKNKNIDAYINALYTYTSITRILIDIIIEYMNNIKIINIKYVRSFEFDTDELITMDIITDYCAIQMFITLEFNPTIYIYEGKLAIFKSMDILRFNTGKGILSQIKKFTNSENNNIEINACIFFNTYMKCKYSITNYFENVDLGKIYIIDHCHELVIGYDKFSMIAYGKNDSIAHVVTVENPEQFEEIIHTTKLFYDLFKK